MMEQGKYGYFNLEDREYVITQPQTPTPWINYLGDGEYGGIISNNAGGFSFDQDPRFKRVLRYRYNGIPMDQPGRYLYLRDDETSKIWSATWQPIQAAYDAYECRHGLGYTKITMEHEGIRTEVTYFVPNGQKMELWCFKIQNLSGRPRKISVFSYAEFCFFDAAKDQQNADWVQQIQSGEFHENTIYWNAFMKTWDFIFMTASRPADSFDTSREEFVGRYRDLKNPLAVTNGECFNSIAHRGNGVGALCHHLKLDANATEEIVYTLGTTPEMKLPEKAKAFLEPTAAKAALQALKAYWLDYLNAYQVETPDPELNLMLNTWNPYQCKTTFNWSRFVSLYQLGVDRGMGLRDSAQDILGVLQSIPEKAKVLLRRLLKCQFADGHAYHLFYPLTGEGTMGEAEGGKYNWYSDDHLWLIEATTAYLRETGDFAFLDEMIGYANEGENTVWNHLCQAIEFTKNHLGEHDLPLNGFADWNDALNLDRGKGRAESVWTGMLYSRVLQMMSGLANRTKKEPTAAYFENLFQAIKTAINEHAWDGNWYLQAFDDNGVKVGSHTRENEEQIYLNPQAWSIMSGIAAPERGKVALQQAMELLGTEFGLVLLYPAYKAHRADRGGVSTYPPGAKENAGIFVHTNPWFVIASLLVGEHETAYDYYRRILPIRKNEIPDRHEVEPYVYCQNILGKEHPQFGLGRNSWLTGTAAWAYVAGTQYLLGVRPDYDGLIIEPRVPAAWKEFSITRRFRGCQLQISFKRGTEKQLLLDGVRQAETNYLSATTLAGKKIAKITVII